MSELTCVECGSPRESETGTCMACGAPPGGPDQRRGPGTVRDTDLEPYTTLRYVARLFKILAVVIIVTLIAEVIIGVMTAGTGSIVTLISEATRLLVLAGLLWAVGDMAVLLIDAGHDLRVARILLGRINSELHRQNEAPAQEPPQRRVM